MSTLMRRDPLAEFDSMVESMQRAFDSFWNSTLPAYNGMNLVPIDVYEKPDAFFLRAAVPGVKPDQLDVSVEKNVLTIRGETKDDWQTEDAKVYRREHRYGSFARSVRLPDNLEVDKIDASFDHGVLTVRIPKSPQMLKEQSRKIQIRTATGSEGPKAIEQTSQPTSETRNGKKEAVGAGHK
jgi:HSP20 family protein